MRFTPQDGYIFEKLFGSEGNKGLLKSFVNSALPPEERLREIFLDNPNNHKASWYSKVSAVDERAVDERGRLYNIEMQMNDDTCYDKRSLYY
jgi:predicted transposase/invertase (TIGR01784 family)